MNDWFDLLEKLDWLPPPVLARIERALKKIPAVRREIDKQMDKILETLEDSAHPHADEDEPLTELPKRGRDRKSILARMKELTRREESSWKKGQVSGAVYHGDPAHVDFLNEAYALSSQTNPLHSDLWPSITRYEAEIVSMTARMLNAPDNVPDPASVGGTVTSGGSESILLAMKTYRDHAREVRGIARPQMVVPTTAHAAFDKAAGYFDMEIVKVPVGPDFRADVSAMRKAIGKRTAVVVGSAPGFPHGAIDPIEELAAMAHQRGIGFHTDACLGGFVLPWAEKLGYPVPPFDFRVPGVTSMSVDTHKYGYAAKGTSVVLYRGRDLRHFQYYACTDWPGGLYFSPTFAGSRPGGLSAACWAAMVSTGEAGYMKATRAILKTADRLKAGIVRIPGLKILGDPLWVLAFASDTLDIYRVMERMTAQGWNLNGLYKPPCVHLCVTLRHTQRGVATRFLADLKRAVDHVAAHPGEGGGMAPVYGMAGTMPVRGLVREMMLRYLDTLYRPRRRSSSLRGTKKPTR